MRTGADGVERVAFIGYVAETRPDGDLLHVNVRAPESLITQSRRPPFPAPLGEYVVEPKVFDFFWKQLDYVFELEDPRTFPPLPVDLTSKDRATVERFVHVASELAGSALINSVREGFNVRMPDGPSGEEEIEAELSRADVQGGFAALLRQCDAPEERASFTRVRNILYIACDAATDEYRDRRVRRLEAWRRAINRLHAKSLNQLLRDKLVRTEGMAAFDYREEHSPQQLRSIYNYGDLLHWGDRSAELQAFARDRYVELDRRLAYLDGAAGLAHGYIGFGEVARSAIGRVLTPEQ
jgi:hypothetical protein